VIRRPVKSDETANRRHPRKPIRANVTYNYENVRLNRIMTGSGFTMNLSKGGALIE